MGWLWVKFVVVNFSAKVIIRLPLIYFVFYYITDLYIFPHFYKCSLIFFRTTLNQDYDGGYNSKMKFFSSLTS